MKKQIITIICAVAATSAFASPAKNFKFFDANKDGIIQKEEFIALQTKRLTRQGKAVDAEKLAKNFGRKDKDGDGTLSPAEFGVK